jgi:hypothetical protein
MEAVMDQDSWVSISFIKKALLDVIAQASRDVYWQQKLLPMMLDLDACL